MGPERAPDTEIGRVALAIGEQLEGCFTSEAEEGQAGPAWPANVVDGLFAIARGLHHVASAIEWLGNGDAGGPDGRRGGLEAHGMAVLEAADRIAGAISSLEPVDPAELEAIRKAYLPPASEGSEKPPGESGEEEG